MTPQVSQNFKIKFCLGMFNQHCILIYSARNLELTKSTPQLKAKVNVSLRNCLENVSPLQMAECIIPCLPKITKRATPNKIAKYKLALQLHRTFSQMSPENEWMDLNWNQILTSRQTKFIVNRDNNSRVGMNCLVNTFHVLKNSIPLMWLNEFIYSYKIKCKKLFLW